MPTIAELLKKAAESSPPQKQRLLEQLEMVKAERDLARERGYEMADVNERLERENASLKAERDHLNKELSAICTLADAHDAAEACEVIRAMREAIKMAWRIIEPYSDSSRSNGHLPMCPECHRVAAWDEEHKEDCVIGNALAALQPFIPTNCGQSADTPPESAPNSNPS